MVVRFPGELVSGGSLWVVDPFRIGMNAARSLTRFMEIKEVFGETFEKIIAIIKDSKHKASLESIVQVDRLFN